FLSQQTRRHVLQSIHCGIFTEDIIADFGSRYGLAHPGGRLGDRIAAEINHCKTLNDGHLCTNLAGRKMPWITGRTLHFLASPPQERVDFRGSPPSMTRPKSQGYGQEDPRNSLLSHGRCHSFVSLYPGLHTIRSSKTPTSRFRHVEELDRSMVDGGFKPMLSYL